MTDLEIAQNAKMLKITEIATKLGIDIDDLELYGNYKAKVNLDVIKKSKKNGKVILVTAINPTPAGEGKSTTTIGLADALTKLNKNTVAAIREPSFGPVLGVKGGAAGGGFAQVVPMEDINLHFTGDIHAITTANNAIAAIIDNHIQHGNDLKIDPTRIIWKRCLDMNDRALRNVIVGLGGSVNGTPREDHFDITVASEIMALLCLSSSLDDFKEKVGKIVIGYTYDKQIVTVNDLGCAGAIAMIMKDAIKPNLVQTLEHTPVLIHGGPFANIAHGCNSAIATKMAMGLGDYVVTEAGFGADLGAEKFFDIKCLKTGIKPSVVVIVATIRALKMHGGVKKEDLNVENVDALKLGFENLEKHIENIKKYNLPYVVAINKFVTDTKNEVETLFNWAKENNHSVSISEVWGKGGLGGIDLAEKVLDKIEKEDGAKTFKPLYELDLPIKDKIIKVCKEIYGADDVEFSSTALSQLKNVKKNGWDNLPVCMAKNQYSFSDNPKLLGRPRNFTINIRELKPSIGAGFMVVLTGDVMTMPGLPKEPAALKMDIVEDKIIGLF